MLRLERLHLDASDWSALDAFPDRVLFQTRAWLSFVAATQNAEPVVAALTDGGQTVGYFTGLVVRRYGFRILGSPFVGWTTPYMGFNLAPGVPRTAALRSLVPFAFEELRCAHVEVRDRGLTPAEADAAGWEATANPVFLLDLRSSDDELLSGMSSSRRRNVRFSARRGVTVEEADAGGFAEDYYAQLRDVFAKQSLVPTYGLERVRELVRHLHPTGHLLLVRARNSDGESIATGIFPAFNGVAYFWGGASWREHQHLKPNEAVMWYAMTFWRDRGVRELDLGGGADYKRSYGAVVETDVPEFRRARSRALLELRHLAKRAFRTSLRARGRLAARRTGRTPRR